MAEILTIYFSRAGQNYSNGRLVKLDKGNSAVAAETVQRAVGGDIFEAVPLEAYPDDYEACTDRARREYNEGERPLLKTYPGDVSKYDAIFLCYPNWWGTMPMPMFTLLEKLDLAGKKIAPLCTNEGSGLGRSEDDLRRMFKRSHVVKGLSVHGSAVVQAEKIITDWARSALTEQPPTD